MKALIIIATLLLSSHSLASTTWTTESRSPYEAQTILNKMLARVLSNSEEAEVTLNQQMRISNESKLLIVVRKITRGFNAAGYYEQVHQTICNRLNLTSLSQSVRQSVCAEASYEIRYRRDIKKALK